MTLSYFRALGDLTNEVIMSGDHDKYRNMVLAFRMSELQTLMVFAGRSKTGRKTDLQVNVPDLNASLRFLKDFFGHPSPTVYWLQTIVSFTACY